ncbi:Glycosyltransferase (GlcNAc) [Izhakiella capsodis]|uniref:Glycosyltransferase (GlcNAc) n=1 Tax=Izhakiella capsodis TaxID=1367852 RepID=A0A1I5A1Z6_9GAMM|nr:GlcNAc-transferase family protein [Izhakiella capsodis]SFN56428.1 Glycosyltransferase (GlcNAc) [Izhakiella capsodis]
MAAEETLFISIASYRDPELLPTLQDLIQHAQYANRLNIAVCLQAELDIQPFIDAGMILIDSTTHKQFPCYLFRWLGASVKIINVHYLKSEGACWARHLLDTCYDQQDYFMQIDSHCRFILHWDSEMISMLGSLRQFSQWPVLSSYPPGYIPGVNEVRKDFVSRLIFNGFTDEGILSLSSKPFSASSPQRCGYLAAGFIFADGHFASRVPNDPNIFFMGEEISMSARAWLQGYDIWSPHRVLLWHFYTRSDAPKIWQDHTNDAKSAGIVSNAWWERDKAAKRHVLNQLTIDKNQANNNATQRTLQEYQYRIGVNFNQLTIHPTILPPDSVSWFENLPDNDDQWLASLRFFHEKKLRLDHDEININDPDVVWWQISIYAVDNTPLAINNMLPNALQRGPEQSDSNIITLDLRFTTSQSNPVTFIRLCPYRNKTGWGSVLEKSW